MIAIVADTHIWHPMTLAMPLIPSLFLVSDAALLCVVGAVFVLLAMLAAWADGRRTRRTRIDRVGWVPWTALFLTFAVIGGGLLVAGVPALINGQAG